MEKEQKKQEETRGVFPRIEVNADLLLAALSPNVSEKNSSLPILSTVRLFTRGGDLCVHSSDLENALVSRVKTGSIEGAADGWRVCVNPLPIVKILKTLKGYDVGITQEDSRLVITHWKSNYRFATMPAEEFPVVPRVNDETEKNAKSSMRNTASM